MYVAAMNLVMIMITTLCDWRIIVLNRRIRKFKLVKCKNLHNFVLISEYESIDGYSLSRNYQTKENVLAMRLILPLDLCHALLFSIYMAIMLILRLYFEVIPRVDFNIASSLASTVL